jgi:hypothetical protein
LGGQIVLGERKKEKKSPADAGTFVVEIELHTASNIKQ